MFDFFKKESEAAVKRDREMGAETILKTRESLKIHKSKGNQLMSIVSIFFFSLFVMTSLQSCDKAKALDGTTWNGECDFVDPDDDDITYKGTVTISFVGDNADIVAKLKGKDAYDGYTWTFTEKGTASYTYEKKTITLRVKWKDDDMDYLDDGKWTGTVDTKAGTMKLKNVFGEAVTFKK